TEPPLLVPAVLEATSAPPDSAIAPLAANTTSPASPLEPGRAAALIPLAPLGSVARHVRTVGTTRSTLQPLQCTAVELAVGGPLSPVSLPPFTVTGPASPLAAARPRSPAPKVLDVILAPLDSVIAPSAVKTTLPASPLEPGRAAALIPLAPL